MRADKDEKTAIIREEAALRAFAAAGVLVVILDRDGRVMQINRKGCELLGCSEKEIVGSDWFETFLPSRIRQETRGVFDRLLSGEGPVARYHENPILTCNGEERVIAWNNDVIHDRSGKIVGTVGAGIDITGRKMTERALEESRERYRSIFESTTDALFVFDLDGKIVEANPNAYRMYGYGEGELIGLPASAIVHPDYFHGLVNFQKAIEEEGVFASRSVNVRKDGTAFDVEVRGARFTFESQPHLLALVRDIGEQVKAERALESARQKVERLHEAAQRLEQCERGEDVYRTALAAAEGILGFGICTIDILEGDRLVAKATSNGLPEGTSISAPLSEESLATKTYKTGKSFLFGSLAEVPEARPTSSDFKSGISAPIGRYGVFQVASPQENAFTDDDVRLLELLLGHTSQAIARIRLQNELREQARRDPLTGVHNRRYFNEVVEQEFVRSRRYDHPIGFLMIDVDRFKEINDRFGHQIGDRVLKAVAELLIGQVRESDIVVRYGGDEFLIMLLETDGETEAVAERIRNAVAERNKTNELIPFPVTLSIGAAHWNPESKKPIEQILAEADERMYADKKSKDDG